MADALLSPVGSGTSLSWLVSTFSACGSKDSLSVSDIGSSSFSKFFLDAFFVSVFFFGAMMEEIAVENKLSAIELKGSAYEQHVNSLSAAFAIYSSGSMSHDCCIFAIYSPYVLCIIFVCSVNFGLIGK